MEAEPALLVTDLIYQVAYDWCRCKGSFSLRRKARTWAEVVFYVAPEYRWSAERLRGADEVRL